MSNSETHSVCNARINKTYCCYCVPHEGCDYPTEPNKPGICPECKGAGYMKVYVPATNHNTVQLCPTCHGTGIAPKSETTGNPGETGLEPTVTSADNNKKSVISATPSEPIEATDSAELERLISDLEQAAISNYEGTVVAYRELIKIELEEARAAIQTHITRQVEAAVAKARFEGQKDAYFDCGSKAGNGKTVRTYAKSRLLLLPLDQQGAKS